jgi:hypothetical protein
MIGKCAGHYLLNGPLDLIVCIGAMTTIVAIANYTLDTTPAVQSLPGSK